MLLYVIVLICASQFVASSPVGDNHQQDSGSSPDSFSSNLDDFYTSAWRQLYDDESLLLQPRWRLIKDMTSQSDYQIREYVNTQWADSTSCYNESTVGSFREEMHKTLSEKKEGHKDLLFPLIIRVKTGSFKLPAFGLKTSELEQCRYSYEFFYPLFGVIDTFDFKFEYSKTSLAFVHSYVENFTMAHCNEKAERLKHLLTRDGQKFDTTSWRCAQYNPGKGDKVLYEVWFQYITD